MQGRLEGVCWGALQVERGLKSSAQCTCNARAPPMAPTHHRECQHTPVPSLPIRPFFIPLLSPLKGVCGGGGGAANNQACCHTLASDIPGTGRSSLTVRSRLYKCKDGALNHAVHCRVLMVRASGQLTGMLPSVH